VHWVPIAAARKASQLIDRLPDFGFRKAQDVLGARGSRPEEAQRQRRPDEALLRAVVQVSLKPPSLRVTSREDTAARGTQVDQL
jgi:hypothetical protein